MTVKRPRHAFPAAAAWLQRCLDEGCFERYRRGGAITRAFRALFGDESPIWYRAYARSPEAEFCADATCGCRSFPRCTLLRVCGAVDIVFEYFALRVLPAVPRDAASLTCPLSCALHAGRAMLRAVGAQRVVAGHTPQQSGRVLSRCGGRVAVIDVGMSHYYYGHLAVWGCRCGTAFALYPGGRVEPLPLNELLPLDATTAPGDSTVRQQ